MLIQLVAQVAKAVKSQLAVFQLKITVLEVNFCGSSTLNEIDILFGNHGNNMLRVSLKYS